MLQYVLAFAMAILSSLMLGKAIIPILAKMKFGQSIRELGPQSHMVKQGTPTMGGFIFLSGFLCTMAFFFNFSIPSLIMLLSTLGLGCVGYLDDYLIIKRKKNLGLTPKQKLFGQVIVAAVVTVLCAMQFGTALLVPFTSMSLDLGWFYYPFMIVFILAIANGVNLTDGIDGLCGSVTFVNMLFYFVAIFALGKLDLALCAIAMAGGLVGYVYYNKYPAKVFMGDLGSLALGGAIAGLSMASGLVLFVPIVGLIYVIETLSVVIQVGYFKRTKKRIFKMAPYHHHLELSGFKENKIVILFSSITLVMAILSYIGLWVGGLHV